MDNSSKLLLYILTLAVVVTISMYMMRGLIDNQHTRLQRLENNIEIYDKTIYQPYTYTWSA